MIVLLTIVPLYAMLPIGCKQHGCYGAMQNTVLISLFNCGQAGKIEKTKECCLEMISVKPVFDKADYRYQLHKNIFGIPGLFLRDLKCCGQRIRKGYCYKDLWDIGDWFLKLMPDMLQEYKENRSGSPGCLGEDYTNAEGILCNDTCHKEWDKILEQMIFLFREADEATCIKKNPLEDESNRIYEEFREKYGLLGEKLQTEEEKASACSTMHFPSELPEYAQTMEQYHMENRKLEAYRDQCKDEAFTLFSKWFRALWD